ncbi:Uncharacterised protein [Vibrio cholerae]|nr:Uncharacterised protein [Vibrio cholerae]CSC29565.1 Uncharacterised protein [Vibrio cholerae]
MHTNTTQRRNQHNNKQRVTNKTVDKVYDSLIHLFLFQYIRHTTCNPFNHKVTDK